MLRTRSRLGLHSVFDYLADGIAFPDHTDVAVLVEAAGVDAYELLQRPGRDAAAGMAVGGELAGDEDDGRAGLAGPGTAVDQEGGQVSPWQAGWPCDSSPRPHAERSTVVDWVEADRQANYLEFGAELHPGSRADARIGVEIGPALLRHAAQRQRDDVYLRSVVWMFQPVRPPVLKYVRLTVLAS
jgi:hypothetical protein